MFNILIDNTDDHEKNHALVCGADRLYELSAAYDVRPAAQGLGYQQMRVGQQGHDASLANALSEASAFGLSAASARSMAAHIAQQT
jgi:serine/threonine-protein kinase HipA